MASSWVEKLGRKRKTRSWVPRPRPLRMEIEAAYRPDSVSFAKGDRQNRSTEKVMAEEGFK